LGYVVVTDDGQHASLDEFCKTFVAGITASALKELELEELAE
jgi:hypothetical protein